LYSGFVLHCGTLNPEPCSQVLVLESTLIINPKP